MQTIGELLKQWRLRRQLSQLDLALSADVSPRHVSLIETGRSNPSADMVLRLAARLDVPLRDRNQLLLTAGFAPRYTERPLDSNALSVARDAIERVLRAHEPYPAFVLDRRWNIVLMNGATDPFFKGLDFDLLRPPINIARLALDPPRRHGERGLRQAGITPRPLRATNRLVGTPVYRRGRVH